MRKASRQDADAAEGELEGSKCLSRIGPPVSKRRSDNAPICHHSLQFVNETGGGHFILHGTAQASGRIPGATKTRARIATLAMACLPATPDFGALRPVIRRIEKTANTANRADDRPWVSSIRNPTSPPSPGSGPRWAAHIPKTARPRARSMPTSRSTTDPWLAPAIGEFSAGGACAMLGSFLGYVDRGVRDRRAGRLLPSSHPQGCKSRSNLTDRAGDRSLCLLFSSLADGKQHIGLPSLWRGPDKPHTACRGAAILRQWR